MAMAIAKGYQSGRPVDPPARIANGDDFLAPQLPECDASVYRVPSRRSVNARVTERPATNWFGTKLLSSSGTVNAYGDFIGILVNGRRRDGDRHIVQAE